MILVFYGQFVAILYFLRSKMSGNLYYHNPYLSILYQSLKNISTEPF